MTTDQRVRRTALSRLPLAISLLALVIAMSGTAVAAGLAANSVGSKQLKKNAVKTVDIKNNAVTGAKVKNGSIGAGDLAAGVLPERSLSYDRNLASGGTVAAVSYAGITISHECEIAGGDIVARTIIQTAGNELDNAGTFVLSDGGTTASTSYFTDGTSLSVAAAAAPAGNATTIYEGMVRGADGPWIDVTIAAGKTVSGTPCRLRGLFTAER